MNIILLSELVKKNGSRIGGDYKIDQDDSMTTSSAEPPVTTDDFIKTTRQGKTLYMYRSFYTEDDEENQDAKLPKKDKQKKNPKKAKTKKKLKEGVMWDKLRDKLHDLAIMAKSIGYSVRKIPNLYKLKKSGDEEGYKKEMNNLKSFVQNQLDKHPKYEKRGMLKKVMRELKKLDDLVYGEFDKDPSKFNKHQQDILLSKMKVTDSGIERDLDMYKLVGKKEDPHTGEDLTEGRRKKRRKTKRKLKEDVFTKKEFDREFVEKQISDLTNKEIPNLEALRESNPILIRKVTALRDIIEKNNTSGEEIGVILNFLLDMNLRELPKDYKNILKNKLN